MWVSRQEWKQVQDRLDRMEIAINTHAHTLRGLPIPPEHPRMRLWDCDLYAGYHFVPFDRAIALILAKLGVKLAQTRAIPSYPELQPVEAIRVTPDSKTEENN